MADSPNDDALPLTLSPDARQGVLASVSMRPGRNGGSIRVGGTNQGGPGRPTDALRLTMRYALEERIPLLLSIIDGAPLDTFVLPDGSVVRVPCQMRDRIKALDLLAKYGLGVQKDITKTTRQVRIAIVREIRDTAATNGNGRHG